MKKIIILTLIVTLTMNVYAQKEKLERLGFISELVYIKYSSEAILNSVDDSLHQNPIDTKLIPLYNITRIMVDQLVLQLEADMKVNNSTRYYKQLDKLLTKNNLYDLDIDQEKGKIKSYIIGLLQINKAHNNLLNNYQGKSRLLKEGLTEAIDIWNVVNTIIKQHSEAKASKVAAICTILDSLRLLPNRSASR